MKSLLFGLMISAVSLSFAQTDTNNPYLRKRLDTKAEMRVEPAVMVVQGHKVYQQERIETSGSAQGIVHIIDGKPVIYTFEKTINRRMVPTNLPKAMAIDGQKIQFDYTISDDNSLDRASAVIVNVQNVSIALK